MKIIITDNYDRENVSEAICCENVDRRHGELIVRLLNDSFGVNDPNYYKLVEDSYKLYVWEPQMKMNDDLWWPTFDAYWFIFGVLMSEYDNLYPSGWWDCRSMG